MRILYGVQATGNGHISRARALVAPLHAAGAQVDFVFSGRSREALFAMEPFANFQLFRGLSFVTCAGKMQWLATWRQLDFSQLFRDISALDTTGYDLVLTDFEPVTAWAAHRQGTPCIGIGHQYAFLQPIPTQHVTPWHQLLFRWFAPAKQSLGLHWHHFDSQLAPPLLHIDDAGGHVNPNQVLVYLPFESLETLLAWLKPLQHIQFCVFHPTIKVAQQHGHISCRPPDLEHFKLAFASSPAVLANAGFELISEALQQQKRILVKPLQGQPEQASNAKALAQLQYADTCKTINSHRIAHWFEHYQPAKQVHFANVAQAMPHLLRYQLTHQQWPQAQLKALWGA